MIKGLDQLGLFLWLLNSLMIYCLYTLVDITNTGQFRSRSDLERLQQQNFDTVLSVIGLSGNLSYAESPKIIPADIFGVHKERCWYFEWQMQGEQIFEVDNDPIFILKETFENVPFIAGLTESVQFDRPIFRLGRNIVFSYKL